MAPLVARRGVLQAGTLTSGLVLAGLRPQPAAAAPDRPSPITGKIAAYIRIALMQGTTIRLMLSLSAISHGWRFR